MPKKPIKHKSKKLTVANPKKSYEKDYYKWTLQQADLLKKGKFEKLDVAHLVDEIESLGKSERSKLESFLTILLIHMLKVKYQPSRHSPSWDLSIKNSKNKAKDVLKENPSLKSQLEPLLKKAYGYTRVDAAIETGLDEKIFPSLCPWKIEELI